LNIRDTLIGKISKNAVDNHLFIDGKMGKDAGQPYQAGPALNRLSA
jgi:hypothetical protein